MRYTLPQRATRHALIEEGAHVLAVPPRCAGASPSPPWSAARCPWPVRPSRSTGSRSPRHRDRRPRVDRSGRRRQGRRRGLATTTRRSGRLTTTSDDSDGRLQGRTPSRLTTESPVLDTSALAETVREANEEGKRLAEKQESDDSGDDSDAVRPPPPPRPAAAAPRCGFGAHRVEVPRRADRHQRVVPDPAHRQGGQPGHRRGLEARDLPLQVLRPDPGARRHRLHRRRRRRHHQSSHYPRSELREMNGEREGQLGRAQGHARHGASTRPSPRRPTPSRT